MSQKEELQKLLTLKQFPRSAKYDIEWLAENEMGPCSVWLAEYLTESLKLKPGMRILDMGCGKAMSSIFMAREFGVQVFATDLWIDASANWRRIKDAKVDNLVIPVHAEAHNLPFADEFFDAIVSLDAYHYFGTDELYLPNFIRFLKPTGQLGIVVPGVKTELGSTIPENLKKYWDPEFFTFHSPEWWSQLWLRSGKVRIDLADNMPNGHEIWLKWDKALKEAGALKRTGDVEILEADEGNLTFTRIIATRL